MKQKLSLFIIVFIVIISCAICFAVQNNKISKLEYAAKSAKVSANSEFSSYNNKLSVLKSENEAHKSNEEFYYSIMESYAETDYKIYSKEESKFFKSLSDDKKALYSRAYDEGYEGGFMDGADSEHDKAYNEGEDKGYSMGEESGYEEGYQKGYDKGYRDGYDEAKDYYND
ncbi:MAG: hypothetical protein IJ731_06085 [Eubacterium sp.]|nr:hypothetical protein [Eubacterium sp.]